ncbi:MAG: NAD(P)H-dependent oxidoreductase [Candidatus Schmidhempelia sp.]|nr:NAD(P)H-dependent oxidoreductase [Candidatus Schmidhempelia sp.]
MKKTLLLIAHPCLQESIINKSLIEKLKPLTSDNLIIHNICDSCINNQFDIDREQDRLVASERIIFQFPLYFYTCPAILKKWIEDIFTPGFAYGRKGELLGTKLVGKQFSIIVSVGAAESMYTPGGILGVSMHELLKHMQSTIEYIGGIYTYPFYIYEAAFIKEEAKLQDIFECYKDYIFSDYIPKEKQYQKLVKLAYENKAKGYY